MAESRTNCPLCGSPVTRAVYEKITGVWQEKEKHLAELKARQAALARREKDLVERFEKERVAIAARADAAAERRFQAERKKAEAALAAGKRALAAEKKRLETGFKAKLAAETERVLKAAAAAHRKEQAAIKARLEASVNRKIAAEKKRLGQERARTLHEVKLQQDRNGKLLAQYSSLQGKYQKTVESAEKKIRSLEEQVRKNQTPQVLGLLEETVFLEMLRERFPGDEFVHTGKGGDIVHAVLADGARAGVIVYELKKVQSFQNAHVEQARRARDQREADYAVLVTNAKSGKDDPGFSVRKGVIVIHPAGAPVLVGILREQLLALYRLRLGREERGRAVRAVLEYLQGAAFSNALGAVVHDTLELYAELRREVQAHLKSWQFRLEKYRGIHGQAIGIGDRVGALVEGGDDRPKVAATAQIGTIELPDGIR